MAGALPAPAGDCGRADPRSRLTVLMLPVPAFPRVLSSVGHRRKMTRRHHYSSVGVSVGVDAGASGDGAAASSGVFAAAFDCVPGDPPFDAALAEGEGGELPAVVTGELVAVAFAVGGNEALCLLTHLSGSRFVRTRHVWRSCDPRSCRTSRTRDSCTAIRSCGGRINEGSP